MEKYEVGQVVEGFKYHSENDGISVCFYGLI